MTSDGQPAGDESPTPADRAMRAMQDAVSALEQAHAEADNAAAAGAAEQEHVSAFVDAVGEALADGLDKPVGLYAGAVAEETEYYSKTDLKQEIKDKSEEYRGGNKQPLGEFVEERLEEVVVVKTTDHRQGADYIWDFGTFKVETRSGKERRGHFRWDQFRDYIHESGGVHLARPIKDRRGGEEWRDFMSRMIDERGEEQYTRGPRTKAFEALQNRVKRLTGYGTPEGALDHTGIWVVRESYDVPNWFNMGQPFRYDRPEQLDVPSWWDGVGARTVPKKPPEWYGNGEIDSLPLGDPRDLADDTVNEVRVHESVIEPILDDADITRAALYHELNARNLTVPGMSGASMTEWVGGSEQRFWTLLPDLGTPRTYIPDPNATGSDHPPLLDIQADEQADDHTEADPAESVESTAEDGDDGSAFESVGETA